MIVKINHGRTKSVTDTIDSPLHEQQLAYDSVPWIAQTGQWVLESTAGNHFRYYPSERKFAPSYSEKHANEF